MTTRVLPAAPRSTRTSMARALLVMGVPLAVYFAVRPAVSSDAIALAIAGAVPLSYELVLVIWFRRVDLLAVVSSVGFALGCLASVLAGGSSLPLKLHEAAVTFVLGIVLLVAVLVRRPIPIGRRLHVPDATRQVDQTLGVMVGGFLVLHALLHVALAVSLSTTDYLLAGRAVNLSTIAIGALCLFAYLRRARRASAPADGPRS